MKTLKEVIVVEGRYDQIKLQSMLQATIIATDGFRIFRNKEKKDLLRRLAHDEQKCILFSTHELDIALSLCDAIALISPPELHILPTDNMVRSGHIERLFTTGIVEFDPTTRAVSIKTK